MLVLAMDTDEFPWDAVVAGVIGLGVGVVLGRVSVATVRPAGQTMYQPISFDFGGTPFVASTFLKSAKLSCDEWERMNDSERDVALRRFFYATGGPTTGLLLSTATMQSAVNTYCGKQIAMSRVIHPIMR